MGGFAAGFCAPEVTPILFPLEHFKVPDGPLIRQLLYQAFAVGDIYKNNSYSFFFSCNFFSRASS
jgi:hypothetical protein